MGIINQLKKAAENLSEKTAIIFKEQQVSYADLCDTTAKAASVLQSLGVQKGDKVAVYLPNCPEFVYSYLATFWLGAVGVPLDYMLKTEELISCLNHSEARVFIALAKTDVSLAEIKKSVPSLEHIIILNETDESDACVQTWKGLFQVAITDVTPEQVDDKDPALIMYTSGTTGTPKGILLNYKHLEGSPKAMEHFVDLSDKDIKICPIPLSHIGGFIYIQNCVGFGITLVLMDRFNPYEFLRMVQQYKVTCFHIVPPMYNALLTLKQIEKFDLSSLRWVVVFGAPSSPEIMERFHRYCPNAQLLNGWGMTETCPPNTVTPLGSKNIASVGKPSPLCEIKIVDEGGNEQPAGRIGEIIISGWIIMDEYYKDPEATALMKRDGWLHTGDLGKFDDEGYLYIVGRMKEMIKVGGQIVYAPEVEAALYKHEAVAEAAVIGVPDKMKGEAVKAYVVLREGQAVSEEDMRYFAREHLANFKVPHSIEIRRELPKNRTGKIDKSQLKEELVTRDS